MREEIREKIEEKRCGRAAIDLKKAPLCKGSSAAGGEGLFFYNPSTTSWSPSPYTGEA